MRCGRYVARRDLQPLTLSRHSPPRERAKRKPRRLAARSTDGPGSCSRARLRRQPSTKRTAIARPVHLGLLCRGRPSPSRARASRRRRCALGRACERRAGSCCRTLSRGASGQPENGRGSVAAQCQKTRSAIADFELTITSSVLIA